MTSTVHNLVVLWREYDSNLKQPHTHALSDGAFVAVALTPSLLLRLCCVLCHSQ
jgi:hypothetical protein